MGGPSGGCIPATMGDLQIDYQQINQTGAIMGSGGMVVMDETTCMVEMAKFFLRFTQDESCGKCTFCRIGTKRMLEILERITDGQGQAGRHRTAGGPGRQDPQQHHLRPGPDRAQPGADHAEVFPRRVRGPHPRQEMPGPQLRAAADLHHPAKTSAPAARSAPGSARPRPSAAKRRKCTISTRPPASNAASVSKPAISAPSSRIEGEAAMDQNQTHHRRKGSRPPARARPSWK